MKTRLLIIMEALGSGGAEKSLISLLQAFEAYRQQVDIDLLIFKPHGLYYDQIPSYCRVIDKPKEAIMMCHPLSSRYFWKYFTLRGLIAKITHLLKKKLKGEGELGPSQYVWHNWEPFIPCMKEEYDVVMGYFQGMANYFALTKCSAPKKYVYIHHEYQKLPVNFDYDHRIFSRATGILTVSELCVDSVTDMFPDLKGKVHCVENISNPKLIETLAREYLPEQFGGCGENTLKIVSIGRLCGVKRFDRAIEAAAVLKQKGVDFVWAIVGEGEQKDELNKRIVSLGLERQVFLCGVKPNPYPYIGNADVFVQTSDNEGKSLVIDEAKILHKPIVVTRYEKTGILCDFSAESVAQSILRIYGDETLRKTLTGNLAALSFDNKSEIEKYFRLWQA